MRAKRRTMTPQEARGLRIRSERVKRGWSQEELARRAGIASRTVSYIERGKSGKTIERATASRLALALDRTMTWVISGEESAASDDERLETLVMLLRLRWRDVQGTPRGDSIIRSMKAVIDEVQEAPQDSKRRQPRGLS